MIMNQIIMGAMKRVNIISLLASMLLAFSAINVGAQTGISITGVVKDIYGEPIPGVVLTVNHKPIYMTEEDGSFKTITSNNAEIVFSLTGYKQVTKKASSQMTVVLEEDAHKLAELVNLGYTKQYREVLSDAVSTTSEKELSKSPYPRLHQLMTGRLSGMTLLQSGFEPCYESSSCYIRGFGTLHHTGMSIIIDGLPYENYVGDIIHRISPEEVESISLIKDGASQAVYGIRGANGLIVINTKRGSTGRFKFNVGFSETLEKPSYINHQFDSYTYATLRNQAAENDGLGKYNYFSQETLDAFKKGDDILYPDNDWVKLYMRNLSQMQRLSFDASGGSSNVRYFTNINVLHQGGFWNTDPAQTKYDANNNKFRVNFRSNVDVRINNWISLEMNLAGSVVKSHAPGSGVGSNGSIYTWMTGTAPTVYGPLTPKIIDSDGETVLMESGKVIATVNMSNSPYGYLNRSGYNNNTNTNIYGNSALKFDLSFLTPGLWAGARLGYLSYFTATLVTSQNYERYYRDSDWTTLNFVRLGTTEDTALAYSKSQSLYAYMSYKTEAGYTRDFGKHHLNAYAYGTYQSHDDITGNYGSTYDFRRIYSGMEVLYDFDKRYAVKLATGYSASDYFPEKTRFIWTPGVSAAWIISNESFVKNHAPWLSLFKLRASYAITGNDNTGYDRYAYKDQVSSATGGHLGYLEYNTTESVYGNYSLSPEKVTKKNFGIDLGIANQLSVSFDLYKAYMNDGLIRSTTKIPEYQGVALASYPVINMGEYENHGWELSVGYNKRINKDWYVYANGWLTHNENKVLYTGEIARDESYVYPYHTDGFPIGQTWGYLVDYSNGNGLFNFQEEIDNWPTYSFGTPRLGDIRYKDLNEDGTIDEKDLFPIGHGSQPHYTFSLDLGLKYKRFELSMLFYGVADYIRNYVSTYTQQTYGDGYYTESHLYAWTPEKWANHERIIFPALSTLSTTNSQTSNFFFKDASFIRLKNIEVSYELPKKWSSRLGSSQARVYADFENPLLFDKMDTKDTPVEGSVTDFPYYRMYRIGVKVSF